MKHEILEEVWRVRGQISAACGHDLKRLATMLRREEAQYGDRLSRLPICRKPRVASRGSSTRKGFAPRH
jgi:hypothetical protein